MSNLPLVFTTGDPIGILLKISREGEIQDLAPNAAEWPAELRPMGLMIERLKAECDALRAELADAKAINWTSREAWRETAEKAQAELAQAEVQLEKLKAKGSQYMAPVNVTNVPEGETVTGYATTLSDDREVLVIRRHSNGEAQVRFKVSHGHKQVTSTLKLSAEAAEAMFGIMTMLGFKAPDLIATTVEIPQVAPGPADA